MKKVFATVSALALGLGSLSANAALIEVWQSSSALSSLAQADALIGSGDADYEQLYDGLIDFDDLGDGTTGFNNINMPWPGAVTSNFAARITGSIDVIADTVWGIFLNHDDGARLSLNGVQIIFADGIADNRTSGSQNNAVLNAGANYVEIVFFERLGGASLELYGGPAGTVSTGDLIGLRTVPAPAPLALIGLSLIGLGWARRRAA